MRFVYKILAFCFLYLVVTGFSVFAQPTANRQLSEKGYLPGFPELVTIVILNNTDGVTVTENLPEGWGVNELIGSYGEISNGSIKWDLPKAVSRIQYVLLPFESASGEAAFSGKIGNIDIGGDSSKEERTPKPVGIFADHGDYPGHNPPGDVVYDTDTGIYTITCGFRQHQDQDGHYTYSTISGSFQFEVTIRSGHSDWGNASLMYVNRPWNDPTRPSPVFYIMRFVSGSIQYGWQESYTSSLFWDENYIQANSIEQRIKFIREGDQFQSYYKNTRTNEWILIEKKTIHMVDPVFVGFGSRTHSGVVAKNYFSEVVLENIETHSSVELWEVY